MAGFARQIRGITAIRRILATSWGRIGLVLAVVLMWIAVFFVDRSFLVQAETSIMRLTFAGEANAWKIPRATICTPRETPEFGAAPTPGAMCSPAIYDITAERDLTLSWACGATLDIEANSNGDLLIEVLGLETVEAQAVPCRGDNTRRIATGRDFPVGVVIGITSDDWRRGPALPFQAEARVGEVLAAGSTRFLQSGRWEARQTSPIFQLFRLHTVTEVVKSGDLSTGVDAAIYANGHPAIMWGHLTPTAVDFENSLPGFDVVMLSAPGRTELRLTHRGAAEPARIRPDWVDTAITSPLFLAIFALLNLLAVLCQIVGDWPFRRSTPAPASDDAEDG